MIKLENTVTPSADQWKAVVLSMRNPMNSWDKSDSYYGYDNDDKPSYIVGDNDLDLMKRLRKAGTDHRKYLRMITVYVDITAPMYWWSEFDTYKVGTVANSTSKMHKLLSKPFVMNDFSFDKLPGYKNEVKQFRPVVEEVARPLVDTLNELRDDWFREEDIEKKKIIWYSILQLLPNSYNQKRTVMLNYEVLNNIYKSRKHHKLDEWSIGFIKWIESLPYAKELITDGEDI